MTRSWDGAICVAIGTVAILSRRVNARTTVRLRMGTQFFGIEQFPDPTKRVEYERNVRRLIVFVGCAFILQGLWLIMTGR